MKTTLKKLGRFIDESKLIQLNELIDSRIWFLRSSFLTAHLYEKTHTSNFFQIPFFFKDECGNEQSKVFEIWVEWIEDEETVLDYYDLKIKIANQEQLTDDFKSIGEHSLKKGLNSSINFNEFQILEIQILSRNEIIDKETELKYDEGILLIDRNKNKILLSAELNITERIEFIYDLNKIENRIKNLKIRKTLG